VGWYEPIGHDKQVAVPTVEEKVPVGHGLQATAPVVVAYCPTGQA